MKTLSALAVLTWALALPAAPRHDHFIRVQGDQLMEDGQPFRFISWNIPNLHLVEDHIPFAPPGTGWRLPDRFEITDALASVRQMGGTVARTYVLSVRRPQDDPALHQEVALGSTEKPFS